MKYFYNTEFESLSDCKNGRFFLRCFDAEKTANQTSKLYQSKKYSEYFMDDLGRIYETKLDTGNLTKNERDDGLFEIKIDDVKFLIDKDMNVICSDYKKVDLFTEDGLAVLTRKDGSQVLIRRDGSIFSDNFKSYSAFVSGFGVVKLDSGLYGFIDENNSLLPYEFETALPFFNKNFTYIKKNDGFYIINRAFEILSGPYEHILFISDDDLIVTKSNDPNKTLDYYDVNGNQIFHNASLVHPAKSGVIRISSTDNESIYYNFETGRQIGGVYGLSSEDFRGSMAPVVVGEDENGLLWTVLKKDGSTFKHLYGAGFSMNDDLVALYVEGENGRKGKYIIVDENETPATNKKFKWITPFFDGIATYEKKANKYSYITEGFKSFEEEFDSAGYFSCGYGVVKSQDKIDAVDASGMHLSEISQFAEQIDLDPASFLKLPEKFVSDKPLVVKLFNLATKNINEAKTHAKSEEDVVKLKKLEDKIIVKYQKLLEESALLF